MQGAHATTRRLIAVVVLVIAGSGCATGPSPTPASSTAPATPAPTAEPAANNWLTNDGYPPPGAPAPSAWEPPWAYGQTDPLFLQDEPLEDSAQLTIDVTDLRDMTGLDLAIGLDYHNIASPAAGVIIAHLLRLPIDVSPYAASTQPVSVPNGRFLVYVFAGQPPCGMGYVPMCRGSSNPEPTPEYGCRMWVDIEPGDDRSISVAGLPRLRPGGSLPDCGAAAG